MVSVTVKMEEPQQDTKPNDDSELKSADDNPAVETVNHDDDDKMMTGIDDVASQLGTNEDIKSVDTEVIDEEKVTAIDDVALQLDTDAVDEKITGNDDVANQQLDTEAIGDKVTSIDDVENLDTEVIEEEKVIRIDDVASQMDTEMVDEKVTGTDDVANQQLETVGSTEDSQSVDMVVEVIEDKMNGIDDVARQLETVVGTKEDLISVYTEMVEDKVTGVDDVANQLDTVGTNEDFESVDTVEVVEEKVNGVDDAENQLDKEMVEEEKVTGVADVANHLEPVEVVAGEKEDNDVANQLRTVGTNEEFQVIGEKVSGIDDVASHLEAAGVAAEKKEDEDEVADKQLETVEVVREKEEEDFKGVGTEVIEEEKVSGTGTPDVANQLETAEIACENEKVSGTDDVAVAAVNEEGIKDVGTEVVVEKEGQQQVGNESSLGSYGGKKRDRSDEVDVAMEEVMVPKVEEDDEAVERRHEDEEEEEVKAMQNQKSFLLDPNVAIGYESGTEDDQATFMKELITFHRQRFLEFKPPKFYGEPLNCLKLWRSVVRLGGYEQVTSCKYWRQVGESFRPPKTCTTVSWTFRCFYEKALLEYEKYKSSIGELPFTDVSSSVPISSIKQTSINQTPGSGRARRDSAARAMQGWHSHRNGEVGDPLIKDKTSSTTVKREKQGIGLLKRKKPSPVERAVKVARMKSSKSQLDSAVVDIGPPADWVKVNVQRTKDCFEVYALVPGLLREEVRVQSDPAGRLVISGQPEQLDNPWGVSPFKKVVSLPSRIDPHQTSAVVTLHGQLFVRVPFEQPSM